MKIKQIITAACVMASSLGMAQDYVDKTGSTATGENIWSGGVDGNVGIGVATPSEKLDVLGAIQFTGDLKSTDHLKIIPGVGKWIELKPTHTGHGVILRSPSETRFASIMMSDNNEFKIGRNGNGAANYNIKINQYGYVDLHSSHTAYGVVIRSPNTMKLTNLLTNNDGHFYIGQTANPYIFINNNNATLNPSFVGIGNVNPTERLEVTGNIKSDGLRINTTATTGGYIAIGTADGTGTTTPYDMVVNGSLGVNKLRVDINDTWGDFVFDDNYQLMSINELETFVEENKHLPEIPSAEEIEADGVDMGEMVRQQMIKIEELTLYLIAEHEEVSLLQDKIEEMQLKLSEMNSLK